MTRARPQGRSYRVPLADPLAFVDRSAVFPLSTRLKWWTLPIAFAGSV